MKPLIALAAAGCLAAAWLVPPVNAAPPIPEKLVVLTFDDSSASHSTVAAPLLKRYGFGATFFITEAWTFTTNKRDYMTWEQIAELHRDGFEIGNHTRDHLGVTERSVPRLASMEARRKAAAAAPVFSSDKPLIDLRDAAMVRTRRPLLIAHRGGVVTPRIPEGSLAAMREAARQGYDLVELDIRVTKDGAAVIFHDASLRAATGHPGAMAELTEAEARAIRFRKNDEPIPGLEQALVLCRQLHLGVMLDLKDPPRADVLQKIAALVRKHGLERATLTISAHPLVRAELGEVALVPVNADELKRVGAGESLPLAGRIWFGIPAWIPFETIPKLQQAGALVFPAINLFRYENDPQRAQARREVQALLELGVEGFQIDSAYQDFFGKPLAR
jgi:hypothetical protein